MTFCQAPTLKGLLPILAILLSACSTSPVLRNDVGAREALGPIRERVDAGMVLAARERQGWAPPVSEVAERDQVAKARVLGLDGWQAGAAPGEFEGLARALERKMTLEEGDLSLQEVVDRIARVADLNLLIDEAVERDARLSFLVRNTTVGDVLNLLVASRGLRKKILDQRTLLLYPATAAKDREHLELVARRFYLANADARAAQELVKQVGGIKDVFIDERQNLLVIKGTAAGVGLTEQLISSIEMAEPELHLEVELREVSRDRLRAWGIEFPQQIGLGRLSPTASERGTSLVEPYSALRGLDGLDPFVANPAAVLSMLREDGGSALIANPQIRVRNRSKGSLHVGEKLPVFSTTSTAEIGRSATVSYLDVGVKLEVEPTIFPGGEVDLRMNLELSRVTEEVVAGMGVLAYRVGTRTASMSLRLTDGETLMFGGFVSDEDLAVARTVPGLAELPIAGRIFSQRRGSGVRSEIVMLVTPRVLRKVTPPSSLLVGVPAGTERDVGAPPLRLKPLVGQEVRVLAANALPTGRLSRGGLPLEAEAKDGLSVQGVAKRAPLSLAVSMKTPERVARGQSFSIPIELEGLGDEEGGDLLLAYDVSRLDADASVAGRPGTVRIPLRIVRGFANVNVTFRAKDNVRGTATLAITSVVFPAMDGKERTVPVFKPASIAILEY